VYCEETTTSTVLLIAAAVVGTATDEDADLEEIDLHRRPQRQ
jgi:hypothetical protein